MLKLLEIRGRMGGLALVCLMTCAGCTRFTHLPGKALSLSDDVTIQPIAPSVWLYTASFDLPEYGRVPANGLMLVEKNEALLVNTPWTDSQTALLFDWAREKRQASIRKVILTHSHQDCAGGLAEVHRRGAESWALNKTADLLKTEGKPTPTHSFSGKTTVSCGGKTVELFYPGPGHALDNIVAWLPESRILFAGCLAKSLDAKNLGNTKDGDLQRYPDSLKTVKQTCPDAVLVVPGHGTASGPELLDHTLQLCENPN